MGWEDTINLKYKSTGVSKLGQIQLSVYCWGSPRASCSVAVGNQQVTWRNMCLQTKSSRARSSALVPHSTHLDSTSKPGPIYTLQR